MLEPDEPSPVMVLNEAGGSRFFLTADHAGQRMPRRLGDLGVPAEERARHIGWDIGIAGVTRRLSEALGATAVMQAYSRLVVDCNRDPSWPGAFAMVSEATRVPGNEGLDDAGREARLGAIFRPYHATIDRLLAGRGADTIYAAMHSFTPVYLGVGRAMHVAVLYNRAPRFSQALAALLRRETGLTVAENEPYRLSDKSDYGVPVHAERRGLDYVEVEIRQDLIVGEAGQAEWAARLARLLPRAAEMIGVRA